MIIPFMFFLSILLFLLLSDNPTLHIIFGFELISQYVHGCLSLFLKKLLCRFMIYNIVLIFGIDLDLGLMQSVLLML